jgi:hypothetical protein
MTLSKNEQIALFIVVFLVIAVAGLFIFLLPAIEDIEPNRSALAEREAELERLNTTLGDAAFTRVGEEIVAAYNRGKGAADSFRTRELRDFEADRIVRDLLEQVELYTDDITINRLSTSVLQFNVMPPTGIPYRIRELATIGRPDGYIAEGDTVTPLRRQLVGASRERAMYLYKCWLNRCPNECTRFNADTPRPAPEDVVAAMRHYLDTQSETILAQVVTFEAAMDMAERDELSMLVFNLPHATHIRAMKRGDPYEGPSRTAIAGATIDDDDDDDNNDDGDETPVLREAGGQYVYSVEILFYIVEPLQTPNSDGFHFLSFSTDTQ